MNSYNLRDQNIHVNIKEKFPCTVQAKKSSIPFTGNWLFGMENASMTLDYSRKEYARIKVILKEQFS